MFPLPPKKTIPQKSKTHPKLTLVCLGLKWSKNEVCTETEMTLTHLQFNDDNLSEDTSKQ